MSIIAKGNTFVPCPAGLHQAVCVDVVDLGNVVGQFGTKHKVRIVFQTSELMENGKPFLASKQYTLSLQEKATLRKDLQSWRGRPFTPEELQGFDLEKLLGVNCQINVQHNDRDGQTYANITAIVPLSRGMAKIAAQDYTRKKDREPEPSAVNGSAEMPSSEDVFESDDSVPF